MDNLPQNVGLGDLFPSDAVRSDPRSQFMITQVCLVLLRILTLHENDDYYLDAKNHGYSI